MRNSDRMERGPIDSPDYLIVGHVSREELAAGIALGGTCSYAALTASRLARRTAALTSDGATFRRCRRFWMEFESKTFPSGQHGV